MASFNTLPQDFPEQITKRVIPSSWSLDQDSNPCSSERYDLDLEFLHPFDIRAISTLTFLCFAWF
jgi:hypothetical protein